MKNRKNLRRIVLIIIPLALLLLLLGSLIYYSWLMPGRPRAVLGLSLTNSFYSVLLIPMLTISQVADMAFWGQLGGLSKVLMYAYVLTGLCLPVIQFSLLLSIVDELLHLRSGLGFWNPTKILVVGYGPHCEGILSPAQKGRQVFLWTSEPLPQEKERALLSQGIGVDSSLLSLLSDSTQENQLRTAEKKANRYLSFRRVTHIVLADPQDVRCIQLYLTLSGLPYCRRHTVHFLVQCQDPRNRQILMSYFDSELKRFQNQNGDSANSRMDLQIFDADEIQARSLFRHTGLQQSARGPESMVHLMILGSGSLAKAILFQAMNQGVITEDNPLIIDILDRDTGPLMEELREHFRKGYVEPLPDGTGFCLPGSKADGSLVVRLTSMDIYSPAFPRHLQQVRSSEAPYTYIAVCLEKPGDNLFAAHVFENVTYPTQEKIPVAFRLDPSRKMQEHMESVSWCSPVIFMGRCGRSCSLHQVISPRQEKDIRRYNATYSHVCSSLDGKDSLDPDTLWNSLPCFQRVSNLALYDHQPVKQAGIQGAATSWKLFLRRESMIRTISRNDFSAWLISRKEDQSYRFPDLLRIAMIEHRRFCYNFAARGWGLQPMTGDHRPPKDPPAMLHDCLLCWEDLKKEKPGKLVFDLISTPYLMNLSRQEMQALKKSASLHRNLPDSSKAPSNL